MSTRKPEVLYRAEQDGIAVELTRHQGRLQVTVNSRFNETYSSVSIVDPWYTSVPKTPARPS